MGNVIKIGQQEEHFVPKQGYGVFFERNRRKDLLLAHAIIVMRLAGSAVNIICRQMENVVK